jgi:hypothetical protein
MKSIHKLTAISLGVFLSCSKILYLPRPCFHTFSMTSLRCKPLRV